MPAALALARWSAGLEASAIPADVRARTLELLLDHLGVALRGSVEPSSRAAIAHVREMAPDGRAGVLGTSACSSAPFAALANGTSAHAIEMDDVTRRSSLHPGAAVLPAALALAEARGTSPAELIAAIVAGYELTIRVGDALGGAAAYRRGFHPTGVAGAFGAAAAAARVMGLDAERTARALGIAGTMASGSIEYLSDGSWSKRLNPGWAAHAGVIAADLARHGFSGPLTVLDGAHGALRAYSDAPEPERLTAGLGRGYALMTVSIKPYGCCRYNHGLIDAMLALRAEGLRPEDVRRVRLGVLRAGASLVAEPIERKRHPRNVVDAQFSAPFAAAVALARGAAGLDQYTDEAIADPEIRRLMALTECVADETLEATYPERWAAAVAVERTDGTRVERRVADMYGDPERPLSREALVSKFTSFAGAVLDGRAAAETARRVLALEREASVSGVLGSARPRD